MPNSGQESDGGKLWAQAQRDRATAGLLEAALLDPVLSRVFLLHRDELFRTFTLPEGDAPPFTVAAPGFAYITDSFENTLRGFKRLGKKYERSSPEAAQIEQAKKLTDEVLESVGGGSLNRLTVGVLNAARTNDSLRQLVNSSEPVTFVVLKRAVGESGIDFQPLVDELLAGTREVMQRRRSRSALHQLHMHLDVLRDTIDIQRFQAWVTEMNVAHYRQIVSGQRISEDRWRTIIMHHYGFLEHVPARSASGHEPIRVRPARNRVESERRHARCRRRLATDEAKD